MNLSSQEVEDLAQLENAVRALVKDVIAGTDKHTTLINWDFARSRAWFPKPRLKDAA